MKYIKELDSLRALAILCVIFAHWAPNSTLNIIPWGGIGVHFFFVLSGFLITKILLESSLKAETEKISRAAVVKNFYIRRTLRIFPIYYLTILIVFIFRQYAEVDFRDSLVYYLTYTPNFYFFKTGSWEGQLSHLWSLGVEEQFYLIWPWIIIFINKKYLRVVIIAFILFGILSEYIFDSLPLGTVLPNTCFDGFGLGALLAWQVIFRKDSIAKCYLWISILAAIAFLLFASIFIFPGMPVLVPLRFLTFLIGVWILTYVMLYAETDRLKFKFIFHNRVLIFLGKISYGIYLYHFIIPKLLNTNLINKYINPKLPDILYKAYFGWLFFLENFIMLILISWFSYKFIERPFLDLKKHFTT
ncbi:MAG TPA: acyltransferase [Ferruginibacter sp.]|nr:acyltransferase [Ferruginibacter sp.]